MRVNLEGPYFRFFFFFSQPKRSIVMTSMHFGYGILVSVVPYISLPFCDIFCKAFKVPYLFLSVSKILFCLSYVNWADSLSKTESLLLLVT